MWIKLQAWPDHRWPKNLKGAKKLPVMFNWSLKSCLEPIWQNPKRERTKEIPDEKNFCDFGKIRHDKFENVCFCCDTDLNGVLVTFYRELDWSFFGNLKKQRKKIVRN